MLVNKARAYEIMDKYGLDALIARDPKNVYYLTDFWGSLMKMQRDFSTFAVFPRREDAPAALIMTATEVNRLTHLPTWVPNVIGCSYRVKPNLRDFDPATEDPQAEDWISWPVREGATLGRNEQQWQTLTAEQAGKWVATPVWGLKKALKDAGLERATIGTDDPRLVQWMQELGLPEVKGVDAINIFREIRMIKSPEEIDLLRKAALMNEQACLAAIQAFREGATWDEIETAYQVEMARQGGQGVYITPGPGGLPDGVIKRGEPTMLDALGKYRHYHGDIGRTAVLGEPPDELRRINRAMCIGLETAFEFIRPGVTASELTWKVLDAVHKAGFPGMMIVAPHSIGLEHTDHPLPMGTELPGSRGDLVLQENMVINIDMPYHELGWGAAHLEETVLITATGCEVLTSGRTELQVVPS